MKKILVLASSPVSRNKVNNELEEQGKPNKNLKIPSNVSATFATDQETSPEHNCVSYIYDTKSSKSSLTRQEIKQWKNVAVFLTILVTIFSLSFSVIFLVLSSEVDSCSTIAMGIDAFFAVLGAGFVMWRLCSPDDHGTIVYREKTGSLFFGTSFIISGIITFIISTYRLFIFLHPKKPISVVIALAVFIFISSILAFALYKVARKLDSPILLALAIDTIFASLLSLGVFSTELLYMKMMPKLWYFDAAISIFLSFFFVVCGINLINKTVKSTKKENSSENQ